jgi:hypothetical protein
LEVNCSGLLISALLDRASIEMLESCAAFSSILSLNHI